MAAAAFQPRQLEIVAQYNQLVDAHVADFAAGQIDTLWDVQEFADALCLHPTYLSNTLKQVTGGPPCNYYQLKLLQLAQTWLADPSRTIADVARAMTYDPSNFTKFFKHFAGMTPKQWRAQHLPGLAKGKKKVLAEATA